MASKCFGLLALLSTAFAASVSSVSGVRVTLRVFSGSPNPQWSINSTQADLLKEILSQAKQIKVPQHHIMGYTGFLISEHSHNSVKNTANQAVLGHREAEVFLLNSIPPGLVSDIVRNHVTARIMEDISHPTFTPDEASGTSSVCNEGVVGPDTVPEYNPKTDDKGCFITEQSQNNCYNYGNDIVTNTFAQPGRGSGQKWESNDCSSIMEAAERDGLVWNGTVLPTRPPDQGHFVAMLIWPQTNFHWIRMDNSSYWSHKPGSTAVRDVDDNGKKITDPSKANFSPWTQFCGYFVSVPSKVTIQ